MIKLETKRLIIRELDFKDVDDLFEMDSDVEVHKYVSDDVVKTKDEIIEVIKMLKAQYLETGVGRWAVVDKKTNECLGWCGLKLCKEPLNNHSNFYDFGYRLKRKHWSKGYATESSRVIIDYGFKTLKLNSIYATTDINNKASKNVLTKLGFEHKEVFEDEGYLCDWFELRQNQ